MYIMYEHVCTHTHRSYCCLVCVWSWDFRCLLSPRKQVQCCPADWNAVAMEAEAACLFLKLVQPRKKHPVHTWLHFNSSEITVQCSLSFPIHSCACAALCPQLCWLLSWSTLERPVTIGSFTALQSNLYLCWSKWHRAGAPSWSPVGHTTDRTFLHSCFFLVDKSNWCELITTIVTSFFNKSLK